MKKLVLLLGFWLAAPGIFAQTAAPPPSPSDLGFSSFSMTFSALGIHGNGQTFAVSDLGQAAKVTNSLSMRLDELLASNNANFSSYFAGPKYTFGPLKALQSTTFAPLQLQISGEGGVTRASALATGNPVNKPAARALLDANWNPVATGAVSFNLFEVGYGYLPNLVPGHNHFFTFSAGIKVSLP